MNCPVCSTVLIPRTYDHIIHYDCLHKSEAWYTHFNVKFVHNKCSNYRAVFKNTILRGYHYFNEVTITDLQTDILIVKSHWLPVNINNFPEDIYNIYHRLMKLKAFI